MGGLSRTDRRVSLIAEVAGTLSLFVMFVLPSDSSDKLRQPKIGALMKQVMGSKEDVPGTFSRGGEI